MEDVGYALRQPEVIDLLTKKRLEGMSYRELADLIRNEFNITASITAIRNAISSELNKATLTSPENAFIDKDSVIKNMLERKTQSLEILVNRLEELGKLVETIKTKAMQWNEKLDAQLEDYYEKHKDEGLDITTINEIKDSLHRDVNLINSISNIFFKQWEMYNDLFKMNNPDIKIDNLDMTIKISNEIKNVEKFGYFMIQALDKDFIEKLKEAQEKKQIRILKNIYEKT